MYFNDHRTTSIIIFSPPKTFTSTQRRQKNKTKQKRSEKKLTICYTSLIAAVIKSYKNNTIYTSTYK